MRALVVDDSSTIRKIIRQVLETRFALEVAEAEDVAEALALEGPFDLVVTDLLMPGANGVSLIRSLRERDSLGSVPILVVSVEIQPGMAEQVVEAGATAFLGKPFHLRDLSDQVEALLGT